MKKGSRQVLLDGSLLIVEAMVRAGADVFIGYPITPANLLYAYGAKRFPTALAAPDEITTLKCMAGFAAAGKIPVTATSFPGFALMVESINMAYMMELPMVIVLSQRLGPATGTATLGAQGDLLLLNGVISGGYPLPTLCISSIEDCWLMAAESVRWAVELRCPVVLLTSKDDVMTLRSFDLNTLPTIKPLSRRFYKQSKPYQSYLADETLVPPFLPVGNKHHQVRLNASTHDTWGILQNSSPEALANTRRLPLKLEKHLASFTHFEWLEDKEADTVVFSYGITAQAARQAVNHLRAKKRPVSLLIAKTIFPIPFIYLDILQRHKRIIVAEENLSGQVKGLLFGCANHSGLSGVNAIGRMITPEEIVREVEKHDTPLS